MVIIFIICINYKREKICVAIKMSSKFYSRKVFFGIVLILFGVVFSPIINGIFINSSNSNQDLFILDGLFTANTFETVYGNNTTVTRVDQYQRNYIWGNFLENVGIYKAQSFKPSKSPLVMVRIFIVKLNDADCDMTLSIREDLYGEDLVSETVSSNVIPENPVIDFDFGVVDFNFADIDVEIEKTYYIIFKVECNDYSNYFWPGIHNDSDPYDRGSEWYYCTENASWINYDEIYPYCDRAFETYTYGENNPPNIPSIIGPNSGKRGIDYNYTIVSTDPEADDIFYTIKWGDDRSRYYFTPFTSGEEFVAQHNWSDNGEYTIMVKGNDVYGAESEWATFKVSMPKNKITNNPYFSLLRKHPGLFPMLRYLLQLFQQ